MLSVSRGNIKMGNIPSISLPAVKTCRKGAPCAGKCYAVRMEKRYPNCKTAYDHNLQLWYEYPMIFEIEAIAAAFCSSVFRWHVSGDIPDMEYLKMMCRVANKCKNTKFFAFTKKFEIINGFLDEGNKIPSNLKIIFSGWQGLEMVNPYNLPEAHVIQKDGTCTTKKVKNVCSGNCTECMMNGKGCWNLKKGQAVCFPIH